MPKILVTKPFPFAPDGNRVVTIEQGEQDVSERCAVVAVEHLKVASMVGGVETDDRSTAGKKAPARRTRRD